MHRLVGEEIADPQPQWLDKHACATCGQDFFLKYLASTWAVVLIIGPFFGGHLRPEDNVRGRAAMLSDMRYHTSVIISLFRCEEHTLLEHQVASHMASCTVSCCLVDERRCNSVPLPFLPPDIVLPSPVKSQLRGRLMLCSSTGLLASSSKKFGRLSGYAERVVEAEDAAKQIALDTSRECCVNS